MKLLHPFIDSTIASAIANLDRALDAEAAMASDVRRAILTAHQQVRSLQDLLTIEREVVEESAAKHPTPLRVVKGGL